MGKSPGKWIKTVLFGKKSSKSSLSKNFTAERRAAAPTGDLTVNPLLVSDLPYQTTDRGAENLEYDKGTPASMPCETAVLVPIDQSVNLQGIVGPNLSDNAEIRRQEQAATKVEAAFRGYMARRAFRALKGIIRLQALIRGHLVRRQALATFRCMQSIVKLQALARGQRVRLANPRHKVMVKCTARGLREAKKADVFGRNSSLGSEKLVTNAFICKLLASLPNAMTLSLEYDLAEPNAAWNWLERWSSSHFWEPQAQIKKTADAKSQRKQSGMFTAETEAGESKINNRKVVAAANGGNRALASLEQGKLKTNPRKVTSHLTESVPEQAQNELERVKRNLRKVSAAMAMASEKETEKQHQSPKEVSSSAAPDVFKQEIVNFPPKLVDLDVDVDNLALTEAPSKPLTVDKPIYAPLPTHDDYPADELHSSEICGKMETLPAVSEELSSKEEHNSKEKAKIGRRKSLPAKQEYPQKHASPNTLSLPSYMAATESAKAKLRAQGSSKIEDGAENGFERRRSLPAPTNGILGSLSPRMQKPVQANGKGGSKKNRSLVSSIDDKVLQPGWRR